MRTASSVATDRAAERGFALPATILALVVIGGLVTGAFYAASQENRAGTSSRVATEAFYIAERGIEEVLGTWNVAAFMNVAENTTSPAETVEVTNGAGPIGRYTTRVRRLSDRLGLIQSTGEVMNRGRYTGARRDLAMMVRMLDFDIPTDAAMHVYGDLKVTGTAQVSGVDSDPWPSICTPTGDVSAAVMRDPSSVETSGACNQQGTCLEGEDPLLMSDPDMTQDGMMDFGDLDYDGLAALAEKVITASNPGKTEVTTTNGVCRVSDLMNWGETSDTAHPCFDYFPIIHLKGSTTDFTLSQTNGQGILLVDGNMKVNGNFIFHGIILVKGKLESAGTGNHLNGIVVVAGGSDLGTNQASGNSIIQYSSCSITRAMQNSMRPAAIADRAWADMSGIGAEL